MRPSTVEVSLRNGSHAELVKCSSEESCKSTTESYSSIPSGTADANSNQVLLSNVAFYVAIGVGNLKNSQKACLILK